MLYIYIGVYFFVIAITFVLLTVVFPRAFLRPGASAAVSKDRGINKVETKDGQWIKYAAVTDAEKSVKEYALFKIDNDIYLKMKIDESISYIEYTVVLFNAKNKPFSTLSVCDEISRVGFTEEILLPGETSYVAIYPENVDGRPKKTGFKPNRSKGVVAAYVILSSLLFIVQSLFTPLFVAQLFDTTDSSFFYDYGAGNIFIILFIDAVMLAIYFMAVFLSLNRRKKAG